MQTINGIDITLYSLCIKICNWSLDLGRKFVLIFFKKFCNTIEKVIFLEIIHLVRMQNFTEI